MTAAQARRIVTATIPGAAAFRVLEVAAAPTGATTATDTGRRAFRGEYPGPPTSSSTDISGDLLSGNGTECKQTFAVRLTLCYSKCGAHCICHYGPFRMLEEHCEDISSTLRNVGLDSDHVIVSNSPHLFLLLAAGLLFIHPTRSIYRDRTISIATRIDGDLPRHVVLSPTFITIHVLIDCLVPIITRRDATAVSRCT